MQKLSSRLLEISKNVKNNDIIADVGSDHAFLPIYLLENNIINKAYAIENKLGPYNRMVTNINKSKKNIIPIFSNGLDNLPSDVNSLIIAGMGKSLILDILNKNKSKLDNIDSLIIDSHNDVPSLRKDVCDLGYKIVNETLLIDKDIFYTIIRFEKGTVNYSEKELYFGPILLNNKNDLFYKYHKIRLEKLNKIINVDKKHQKQNNIELNYLLEELNER